MEINRPIKLIQNNGQPLYGDLDAPVSEINYLDYDLRTPMDKPVQGLRKKMAFNQFQFLGLMNEDIIAGVAIVDLKVISNVFVYVYDLNTGRLYERSIIQPLAFGTNIGLKPDVAAGRYGSFGETVEISSNDEGTERYLSVRLRGGASFDVTIFQSEDYTPLRVCSKAGYNGWVYTQKMAGLSAEGVIRWGGKEFTLSKNDTCASSDWSCGFMRRETSWNWACFSGLLKDGRAVGLNLAAGVNETGVTENCMWLDGKKIKLNMAVFEFDRYKPESSWRVETTDGLLALNFEPMGRREEKVNVLLIASNFKQMFGHFTGWMIDADGNKVELERVPGFMEDHYAKW